MFPNDKFERLIKKFPHHHKTFFNRPHFTRRRLFQLAGAGITGSYLAGTARADVRIDEQKVTTINRAKNCIFVLLTGAPSHTDTFDFKNVNGVTPSTFNPVTVNGVTMPSGLLPKMTEQLPNYAIVRSMKSWALVHQLAQTWSQIGRNPAAALGDIAPNIGSIVAIEKEAERRPGQVFPTFLALNSSTAAGSGYLAASYGPFKTNAAVGGLRNTTNADGASRLETRFNLLNSIDGNLRVASPIGRPMEDLDAFYKAAKGMTYNPAVDAAFKFTTPERATYGSTAFGDACLTAGKVLKADQGTRFIQVTFGSWDHHNDIYGAMALPRMADQLDRGVAQLIVDLKAAGLYDSTLVVVAGEFGRTIGQLSAAGGRDHYAQQFCLMGGAGIKGGRALGATDPTGRATVDPGWSAARDVRPEDIEATIYSAMGINWTRTRYDDPFKRGFEYVPYASEGLYAPVNELWA